MTDKLVISVALTGCIHSKADNPALPITPDEMAEDVWRCHNEGASIFHIHARDEQGNPTWRAAHYRKIIDAIRERVPSAIICVSCSGRHGQNFSQRSEVLNLTNIDMASLTLGSVDFRDGTAVNSRDTVSALLRKMERHNILPECEVFDLSHVYYLRELANQRELLGPVYVNLFAGILLPIDWLGVLVGLLPSGTTWGAGGVGVSQFRANAWAINHGGHVRTGLEDNLLMERGKPATNPALVARVVEYARSVGREPATRAGAGGIIWGGRY